MPSGEPVSRTREALGHPLLFPMTGSCGVSAIVSYNADSTKTGGLGVVVFLMSALISLWGFWVVCHIISMEEVPSINCLIDPV